MEGWLDCTSSPQRVYDCLTDYTGLANTFSNISATDVLRDSGRLQVKQTCSWQFLVFSGTFDLLLNVREEPERMALTFDLVESAFMHSFLGVWTVRVCVGHHTLYMYHQQQQQAPAPQVSPLPGGGCRVYHRQQVRPALAPPAVVGTLHGCCSLLHMSRVAVCCTRCIHTVYLRGLLVCICDTPSFRHRGVHAAHLSAAGDNAL